MSIKKTKEMFIVDAMKIHGEKYIYDEVEYVNNRTPIKIICKIHGPFWQQPISHISGKQGCPICGRQRAVSKNSKPFSQFIEEARKVHGDKYMYDENTYTTALKKMKIICPIHGEFWQTPAHHLDGVRCPECAKIERGKKRRNTFEEFVKCAREVHGDKYIYNDTNYQGNKAPINITCPIHGNFSQRPNDHLEGKGCPHCGHNISKAEEEIYQYLCQYISSDEIIRHDKKLLEGLEVDILLPNYQLGIEFNGLRWHTEKFHKDKYYHVQKTNLAESKGYHLIQIFEDEWMEHKDIVLSKLKHFICKDGDKGRVGGRKCHIEPISVNLAKEFLTKYHIQGFGSSTVYLGGFYHDELMAVMSFKQEQSGMWNLTRYASNTDYILPGLANKTLSYFIKNYNPTEIKTFLDRRWSHSGNNLYDKMGFKLVETENPDYRYVDGYERKHKFGFRKQILHKKYGLPLSMTEKEMTQQLGFERIWDCGLYKYIWKRSD